MIAPDGFANHNSGDYVIQSGDLEAIAWALLAAGLAGARAVRSAARGATVVKPDGTPQTAADLASDAAVRAALGESFPGVPVVSEEHLAELPSDFAKRPFLLVDPLDGTREYLDGHPDHAVCVALIVDRRPLAAAIAAPMLRRAWTAGRTASALELDADLRPVGDAHGIAVSAGDVARTIVTSRARPDAPLADCMPREVGASVNPRGGVLKLVAVADGSACLFPTRNPSSEWDIAAGEALVRAAGGAMLGLDGRPLTYGHAERRFLNPPFVAGASEALVRAALAQWPAS
jgi:3'(2'), 5'-bisphosphate nucleotidase